MGLRKWFRSRKAKIENHGEGNVFIGVPPRVHIRCCGTNNRVEFIEPNSNFDAGITIGSPGCPVHDCLVRFEKDVGCAECRIMLMESGSVLRVGEGARIAEKTEIWVTDTHAIFDGDGKLINRGREVVIGKHVWICTRAVILKNTHIPDDCIVAYGSIVSGQREIAPGSILAGNPARVVKTGIRWSGERPEAVLRKQGLA